MSNGNYDSGIGTLSEKTLHRFLKDLYEPDADYQEVAIEGFVADICRGDEIVEIQTGCFDRLKDKLSVFLENYKVTIVHPIPRNKTIKEIDIDTGEITRVRKSPKKGNAYEAFREMYRIRDYLTHPNLTIELVIIDVEELRVPNVGQIKSKKPTIRHDRLPVEIVDKITLTCANDYMMFVPEGLGDTFTAKEFIKAAKVSTKFQGYVISLLTRLDIIEHIGKDKNAYIYRTKF